MVRDAIEAMMLYRADQLTQTKKRSGKKAGPKVKPVTGLAKRVKQIVEAEPGIKTTELAKRLSADAPEIAKIRDRLRSRKSRKPRTQ